MTKYTSLEHAIRNAVRDQNYKKVNEDFEFEMARNELRTAIDAAKRLMAQLDGEGELEAWVQSKITKGADYLDTVADYMDSRDTKKLKEHTKEISESMTIIGNNAKFQGNDYTTPVHIAPGVTQAAVKTAGHRRSQKQQDSATMKNTVTEAKKLEKEDGGDKKKDDFVYGDLENKTWGGTAKDFVPGVGVARAAERTKQSWEKGDYGKAALHGLDTAVSTVADAALAVPVLGTAVGGALKGGSALVRGGLKLGSNLVTKGLEKAGIGAAEKTAVNAGEKAAVGGAVKAGEKAAVGGATKAVAKNTLTKGLGKLAVGAGAAALLGGSGSGTSGSSNSNANDPDQVNTSISQARKHRTFKEETNTRRKDSSKELVGRPDSAGVKDPNSVLARNASIKTKIIDEEKKLAVVVKSVIKKKKEEKESGPNPMVDFEPKLNHKYDNET